MSLIALAFGLLGAVSGSFIGVVAERVHTGQSFLRGRSRCNSCARTLGPADLVPIFSWTFSAGRCRTCGAKVPGLYALLELSLALVFALGYLRLGLTLSLLAFVAATAVLAFIVVYDIRHTIVPPYASGLLAIFALAYALLGASSLHVLGGALFAAGATGALFLALHVFSGGRAMGLGDAPVAFALALIAGPYALAGLFFSFWIGALCGIVILLARQGGPRMGIEVPFVPFLALGYLLALFVEWNPLAYVL